MVVFEKATYPGSNFDHYFEELTKIRKGLGGGDQLVVKTETDRFLKMLADRAYGIHDVAADEIYNFALVVRPTEDTASAAAIELGVGSERPMGVPDHTINTPYEGGRSAKRKAATIGWTTCSIQELRDWGRFRGGDHHPNGVGRFNHSGNGAGLHPRRSIGPGLQQCAYCLTVRRQRHVFKVRR